MGYEEPMGEGRKGEDLSGNILEDDKDIAGLKRRIAELSSVCAYKETVIERLRLEKEELELRLLKTEGNGGAKAKNSEEKEIDLRTDHDHLSVCEVSAKVPWKEGTVDRLADIDKKGNIVVFRFDKGKPPYFENRQQLYRKDGPEKEGALGVWYWKTEANINDSSKDYIETRFAPDISLIEVIPVRDCGTADMLIEKMKDGISIEMSTSHALFSACIGDNRYTGILCPKNVMEEKAGLLKLKSDVFKLPEYDLTEEDIVILGNNKSYYKKIKMGDPDRVALIKSRMEIVKEILVRSMTWKDFRQEGRTRNEWKDFKDFLSRVRTDPVIASISDACEVTGIEAESLLSDFIGTAGDYIEGCSLDDQVLTSAVYSNDELMRRCKEIVKQDWEKENSARVSEAEEKLARLGQDCSRAEQEYRDIESKISEMEQLAEDVEEKVKERIAHARSNAAEFIAEMAFMAGTSQNEHPGWHTAGNSGRPKYISGTETLDHGICNGWKDVIDILHYELTEAGVAEDLAGGLAVYLYAAFLCRIPIMIIGPNAVDIADALSASIFGKMSGRLICDGAYEDTAIRDCLDKGDTVISIIDPLNSNWIERLPETLRTDRDHYFIAVQPFIENVQMEPRSLYNYFLPLVSELFVDQTPSHDFSGAVMSDDFSAFTCRAEEKMYTGILTGLGLNELVRLKMQTIFAYIHDMDKTMTADPDYLFILFPYAYVTLQVPKLMELIKQVKRPENQPSKELIQRLAYMIGEYNG